jgi:formate dehydrogenase maturation protein FdhE
VPKKEVSGYAREIERCSRLYDGFGEAEKFVSAVFSAIEKFFKDNPVVPLPALDGEESEAKLRAGKSVSLNPELNRSDVVELLKKMSEAIQIANPKLKGTVEKLKKELDRYLADSHAQVSKEDLFGLRDTLIKEKVLEQDIATFLFSIMLSSFYRQHIQLSAEVLRTDFWEGGNCPLCETKPHYGLLRSEDGAKQLECWLCGTSWVHTRVKCPYCSNEEREELGYFTAEDNDICRVSYCQSCCQYYKLFDARKFAVDGDTILAIHNLATVGYDLLAGREGYFPGSGLNWVNQSDTADTQD